MNGEDAAMGCERHHWRTANKPPSPFRAFDMCSKCGTARDSVRGRLQDTRDDLGVARELLARSLRVGEDETLAEWEDDVAAFLARPPC